MIVKIIFLLTSLAIVLFIYKIILPKLKLIYNSYKEFKRKKQRQIAFRNKMKRLEIKWISNSLLISKKCRQKIN